MIVINYRCVSSVHQLFVSQKRRFFRSRQVPVPQPKGAIFQMHTRNVAAFEDWHFWREDEDSDVEDLIEPIICAPLT